MGSGYYYLGTHKGVHAFTCLIWNDSDDNSVYWQYQERKREKVKKEIRSVDTYHKWMHTIMFACTERCLLFRGLVCK